MSSENPPIYNRQKKINPKTEILQQNNKEEESLSIKNLNTNNSIIKSTDINLNETLDIEKIKELNSKCVELIFEEKFEIALEILKKIENYLETNIIDAKINFQKKLLIIILHNLSCCYQKIKDYDNCIQYLDGVLYHFDKELENKHNIKINEEYFCQTINKDFSDYELLGDIILELRFSAKFHLQMCAALSLADRHVEALRHAKLAGLICEDNIIKTYYLFIQMKLKNYILKEKKNMLNNIDNNNDEDELDNNLKDNEKMKMTQQIINDLLNLIINNKKGFYPYGKSNNSKEKNNINVFDSYLKYRKSQIRKNNKNNLILKNVRSIFGNEIQKEDWIQLLNIGNIMYLSALNEEDLDLDSDSKYEILRDALLEKIVMLTVSYFCIAIEMYQLSKDKNNIKTNGEFFLYQAVIFSQQFLPVSCPIVKHYIISYYKHFGKDLEIVPEGKILDFKIELIRNEIENTKEIQSFVKLQKINYSNNENNSDILININSSKANIVNKNNINVKGINIMNENTYKENIKNKKSFELKFNLNLNIINRYNNKNNIEKNDSNSVSKANVPQNTKFSISNDNNKASINVNNKNNIYFNENFQNGEIYQLFFNKKSINIAEKSKIKDLPKFKLNFNKINNLDNNREENKIYISKNFQSLSNKINQMNNDKIKKINTKIISDKKTDNKSNKPNKISGNKTDRPKSNKRPNIDDALFNKNNKYKYNGIEIKRNSFIIPFRNNKNFPKSPRYLNKTKKRLLSNNKNKVNGNLTDRVFINKKLNISLGKKNDNLMKPNDYKNKSGYQTQRELIRFKDKKFEKLNLQINLNSGKNSKSPSDNKNGRKNKSNNKYFINNVDKNNKIVNIRNKKIIIFLIILNLIIIINLIIIKQKSNQMLII